MLPAAVIAEAREALSAALVSDVLDDLGHPEHVMHPSIVPVADDMALFGRARTGLYLEVFEVEREPYALEIALVDDLKPDEIAVFACPPTARIGPWGELLSTAAIARGAAGCVTDGYVRDVHEIRRLRFPTFARGRSPLDSKGRGVVSRIDVPVVCGGARVHPGDWLFADVDGVCVIPAALVEPVLDKALAKARAETSMRHELKAGAKLADVFAKYGIL
jgi:regulator of RNase E activity RraA